MGTWFGGRTVYLILWLGCKSLAGVVAPAAVIKLRCLSDAPFNRLRRDGCIGNFLSFFQRISFPVFPEPQLITNVNISSLRSFIVDDPCMIIPF